MRRLTAVLSGLILLVSVGTAASFGTIRGAGQNAEHERITRHAFACGRGLPQEYCFQPKSLDEIAGKGGTWGAVGAPDNPARGLVLSDTAHCDNGDYFATPTYPQTQAKAQATLTACRAGMIGHLNDAVNDARTMLLPNGKIDDSQMPTFISCTYLGQKGRAKCNVLEDLGLLLHASQDFYSHSNWVDQAAPGAVTLNNPPGLNNPGRAAWLNLRADQSFPAGLITGCFDTKSIVSPDSGCPNRVKHEYLNKDKGQIDPSICCGTTPRGKVANNFQKAVNGAISDSQDKLNTFRERLIDRYGLVKANLMMCAISHDNPIAKTSSGGCS